ncbi:hypothetical protein ACWIUO_13280, partial [Helicobacter sp. T3_23-1056]
DDIFTAFKNEVKDFFNNDKLNGDLGNKQTKKFIKRYKIYFHQPNTASGFSATLFYDTQQDKFIVGLE